MIETMTSSLSERLLAVLTGEMATLEAEAAGDGGPPGGAKARIEAVGQMTRTLEKLLELRRLEALAERGGDDPDGETVRLRAEMLRRLQALDARRRDGASLFDGRGRFAGDSRVVDGPASPDAVPADVAQAFEPA